MTEANNGELEANASNWSQAWENVCLQVTVGLFFFLNLFFTSVLNRNQRSYPGQSQQRQITK